jgi:cytoskeletal protein CcmA (bactofilin family)
MSINNNGKQRRTLVEEETEFKGIMKSKCPIAVMGRVDGEIEAPSMHVSPSGSVAGTVKVSELHSEGELAGEIDADSVHLSGRIKDGTVIRARSLEVKLNRDAGKMQLVFGECELSVGDEPDKAAAIEAAKSSDQPVEAKAEATKDDDKGGDADKKKRKKSASQAPPPA